MEIFNKTRTEEIVFEGIDITVKYYITQDEYEVQGRTVKQEILKIDEIKGDGFDGFVSLKSSKELYGSVDGIEADVYDELEETLSNK